MRFLVDAQLPPALAHWLLQRGHQAEHVFELGLASADDREIWQMATTIGAAIITKDEDFATRRVLEADGPVVVWLRIGNASRPETLRWFEAVLANVIDAIERGETLIEIT